MVSLRSMRGKKKKVLVRVNLAVLNGVEIIFTNKLLFHRDETWGTVLDCGTQVRRKKTSPALFKTNKIFTQQPLHTLPLLTHGDNLWMFAGCPNGGEVFTEKPFGLFRDRPQHRQSSVWQQADHASREGDDPTGRVATLSRKLQRKEEGCGEGTIIKA